MIAARLTTPERVLLFCVTSGTGWHRLGIKPPTVQLAIFHRLVEQEVGQLVVTDLGRAVLDALLESGTG